MDWSGSPMTKRSSGPAPGADQLVLDVVDVLELVHQQVAEPPLAGGVLFQRLGQQIVEVQGAQAPSRA